MHKKHMFFYCGLLIVVAIVLLNIMESKGALDIVKARAGLALGVGQGSDPRLPISVNNQNPLYTPKSRRLEGVTAF